MKLPFGMDWVRFNHGESGLFTADRTRQLMRFARARGASASVGALFVVSFPLRGQASGKDDWE